MKEMTDVLNAVQGPKAERLNARRAFLRERGGIWKKIQKGEFPSTYISSGNRKYTGAPRRTAIKCDFLLASKITLGSNYGKDKIADQAQRDLLFSVLRGREVFPHRTGKKFYCCPKCTAKLHECVSAKIFHYIDNAKWKAQIERE